MAESVPTTQGERLTLTDEEMASLSTWDDGSYHCPCPDGCVCSDEEKVHLFDAVAFIVASRLGGRPLHEC